MKKEIVSINYRLTMPYKQKKPFFKKRAAVWTGLEPATSGVTGRHSNQLNYQTNNFASTGGATRTPDTWFWRPVLYQLSYTRKLF